MDVMSLAVLTAICGGAAIYLWMAMAKLQSQLAGLRERAEKSEAEAGKAAERGETLRRKLEKQAEGNAKEDRTAKESRARAAEAKEEVARTRAALKRAEELTAEQAAKLRKADLRIEELQVMANVKRPAPVAIAVPVEVKVDVPAAPPVPQEEDPKWALRRAEMDAEREQRDLERQKLKLERDTLRATQDADHSRETLQKLHIDRDRWRHEALVRESELRLLWRKAEHNRRAYMMTMGALDLAEDELYRIKHGTERPEFAPNRAASIAPAYGTELATAPDAEDVGPGHDAEAPAPAISEPAPAVSEPPPPVTEPTPAVSEPPPAISEPAPAISEPAEDASEPAKDASEPPQAAG